jgi:hypothetical protein
LTSGSSSSLALFVGLVAFVATTGP